MVKAQKARASAEAHIVEGTELIVLASDHHIVDISDGAGEVVARVGRLSGMPNHLHGVMARLRGTVSGSRYK